MMKRFALFWMNGFQSLNDMMTKKKLLLVSVFVGTFSSSLYMLHHQGYRYNATPSYPIGIYKLDTSKSSQSITRGKLVLVCPPDTIAFKKANNQGYVAKGSCPSGYQALIKKVIALSGDSVVINDYVYINGIKQKNSKVYALDSQGHTLIKEYKNYLLKNDEGFVLSDFNDKSFDSRYFGVIALHLIQGEIKAIYTW